MTDTLFSHAKIAVLLDEAFVASRYPEQGGPLADSRTRYLRDFAGMLVDRIKANDIDKGHMTIQEAVCMLTAAALTLHMLSKEAKPCSS